MEFYADEHGYDDSYSRHRQERQRLSSEYGVETTNDFNISGIVDNGGNQMNRSIDYRDSSSGKLFVGGVSWETTEETFADYFGKFGELVDSVIMTDRNTGRPRGFGFVTFADPTVAERVLEEDHIIDDRKVELKRTVPRQGMEFKGASKGNKIFVGGLASSLTEDDLKEYFSFYGNIIEHQIMYDHTTGRSRGFGFVTFQTDEPVDRILSEGKIHELGDKQVEIKRAEPKRGGRDFNNSAAKPYRSQVSGGRYGYEDQYNGKGNGGYSGYGGFGGYGSYGGNYMANSAGFYGGYGYGFGFGPTLYGLGYGVGGYGNMGGYGGATNGYGGGRSNASGVGNGESFTSAKGNGTNGSSASRYHPYR